MENQGELELQNEMVKLFKKLKRKTNGKINIFIYTCQNGEEKKQKNQLA